MGYFVLPLGDTWRDHLNSVKGNIKLLEMSPSCDYLFFFMESCLEEAKKDYYKEFPEKKPPDKT